MHGYSVRGQSGVERRRGFEKQDQQSAEKDRPGIQGVYQRPPRGDGSADDFGFDRAAETVKRPLDGLKVAVHYGCRLLKPSRVMRVDDPDRPTVLENLLRAIGAEPVCHDRTLLCCGKACMSDTIPDRMVIDILESIQSKGAECMGLICPTCFDQFDVRQIILNRKYGRNLPIPVVYYFQLLGLARGLSRAEVGFHLHKIKVDQILDKSGAAV